MNVLLSSLPYKILKAKVEDYWLIACEFIWGGVYWNWKHYYMGSPLYMVIRKLLLNLAEHLSTIALEKSPVHT